MNTTAAAAKAHRTATTIRTWCRRGVIAATKTAGRWTIDETSLDYRLSLDPTPAPKKVTYSIETMTAIGGSEWERYGKHRVYLNDWQEFAGIETTRYGTGNISSASIGGRAIANGRAYNLLGMIDKVYYDAADGKLHASFSRGAREYEIRYRDGERDYIDLVKRVFDGVRAAVAAL